MTAMTSSERLAMPCPSCGARVAAAPGATSIVAWFDCPACAQAWMARIRNGCVSAEDVTLFPGADGHPHS
jgi:hypothetical protein